MAIIIMMVIIMKKMKILVWIYILLMPFYVWAYSEYIIPGGDTLGIEVTSEGVMVVGFYKVNGNLMNQNLRVGDKITKVNNESVSDTTALVDLIDKYKDNNTVDITYLRDNKEHNTSLELVLYNGSYRTGLYVKSKILGIGTLTFIDPETNIYGVLGHSLNIQDSDSLVSIKKGTSYQADITSFTRSVDGVPGSKNANIIKSQVFGSINRNSNYGVFGLTSEQTQTTKDKKLLKVGTIDEVKLGEASIYTTNENDEIKEYKINILEVNKDDKYKNIYFEITDKELLKLSGGIVQGMSGSPIIQDNKIIGAITRVLVDDVNRGFGISIVTMLEEGDKLKTS